jgi:peptide/nickel transport system permease protein
MWQLGVDEFGRDLLTVVLLSAGHSLAKAALVVAILLLVCVLLVHLTEIVLRGRGGGLLRVAFDALDSVPAFVWVLASVSVIPEGGQVLVGLIFIIATLPMAFSVVRGAAREVLAQPYCAAARALGTSNASMLRLHVMPNVAPYLYPLFLHLLGAALAVYGAVGVFGMVSRRDLDLGVMIMRGKEQAAFDTSLILIGVLIYAAIFSLIYAFLSAVRLRSNTAISRGRRTRVPVGE